METSANNENEFKDYPNPESERKTPLILLIVIILLIIAIGIMGYILYNNAQELRKSQEATILIKEEKVELEGKLNSLINEYDSIMTENDSINVLLQTEQEKIRGLLKYRASDATKIVMYKKELETLRKVMRSYIVQIDSLNTRNLELTAENVRVRTRLREVEVDKEKLSQEAEALSTKVQLASVLTAKNVYVEALNKNSKPKSKASKIEKVKVCCTVRENAIASPGTKDVFLRIMRPDDIVLTSSINNTFEYNGEQIVYSAMRQLEYDNKDIDLCIFWDRDEELIDGIYTVILYCEGYEIGHTTFALK